MAEGSGLLRMHQVEKRYGGVRALRRADLTIARPGVVHTLVGENGSGKSTLLGILAGNVRPDGGAIECEGRPCSFRSPVDAVRRGIAMVSQEIAVAPDLTIAENVLLGRRLVKGRLGLSSRKTRERARRILGQLGLDYDPDATVANLRPDQRQMIEIARAVSMDARILILDEPTSSLTDDEVDGLFRTIRELKATGVSVLFVSHRLGDLFELADEVTVLRDGKTVCEASMAEMDPDRLVLEMVGDLVNSASPGGIQGSTGEGNGDPALRPGCRAGQDREVALRVSDLNAGRVLRGIDLEVERGEIVGLAGLAGSGRSELLEAIFGTRPASGYIDVGGESFVPADPRVSIGAGLAYLPPDRKSQGLHMSMSVRDNLTAIYTLPRCRVGLPRKRMEEAVAARASREMGVKAASLEVQVGSLSGGNQQKVALGRWLAVDQEVMLLDEPTRGVDVAAKWEIHRRLKEIARSGKTLLVSSSENDELRELCDRILVLFRGRLVASLIPEETSEVELARIAGGHL